MSHGPHADSTDPFQRRAAVAIAIFTVTLAFANMLTNQSRTKAILSSNRATNQWAYYQSKSTKQNLTKMERDLLASSRPDDPQLAKLDDEMARYAKEKEDIKKRAESLAGEEADAEHKEHFFEYSATVVELAIVMAGVALLLASRKLLGLSTVVAGASLVLMAYTAFLLGHHEAEPHAEAAAEHTER